MAVKFEITEGNKTAIKDLEDLYPEVSKIKASLVFLNEEVNTLFDEIASLLKPKYNVEDLTLLEENTYKFHYFKSVLDYLREDFVEKFNKIKESVHQAFEEFRQKEQEEIKRRHEILDKVQAENRFRTVWSISEIDAFEKKFGYVKKVTYGQESIEVNSVVTWLAMWAMAEKLVRLAGHYDHIFIEAFAPSNKDGQVYELITGS